jgi:hypothetical protein
MYKTLEWILPSEFESPVSQNASMITSFLYEAFLHVDDPVKFEDMRQDIVSAFREKFHSDYEFKTYNDIYETIFQ